MNPNEHLDLGVSSLERSLAFYRGLLGYVRLSEIAAERGERVLDVGRIGGMGPREGYLVEEVRRLAARMERLEQERA